MHPASSIPHLPAHPTSTHPTPRILHPKNTSTLTVSLYGGREAGDDDDRGQQEQQRASRRGVGGSRGGGGGTRGGGGNTGGHKGGVAPPPWHTAPRHGYGGPVLTTMPGGEGVCG